MLNSRPASGRFSRNHHRQPVRRLHPLHRRKRPTLRRHQRPVHHRPNRPRHILRLKRTPHPETAPHPADETPSVSASGCSHARRQPRPQARSAHPSAPERQRSAPPPAPTAHPSPPAGPGSFGLDSIAITTVVAGDSTSLARGNPPSQRHAHNHPKCRCSRHQASGTKRATCSS